ncbi:MAG: RNA pseudouridine synthase [Elusimicrobia bacterium]|nr:RNA pseudouridine synthase [Elusimicrobiota bacterium]
MKYKIETVYENDDIIVLNKPCGLLAAGKVANANEQNLLSLLKQSSKEVYAADKLDKDVSGLIVFAKNKKTNKYLAGLSESGKMIKKYYAVIEGRPKEREGEIDKPIKRGGSGRMSVHFNGQPSITKYFSLRYLKGATLIELYPLTDTRHQLRVHLYYMKHPILGDRLYGDLSRQENYLRIMLHAAVIEFEMPNGKKMKFKKDPPKEFVDILESLD